MQEHYKEFLIYCSSRVYNEVGTIGGAIASHTKYILLVSYCVLCSKLNQNTLMNKYNYKSNQSTNKTR